ncbi:MAG: ABC transporter permease [Planctomycetota bacterium]|nr:ABC transporter permease [Planctomycetota bacterium]
MLRTSIQLAIKDLRIFARDRTGLMLTLVLPIVLASVFGVAMGGMTGGGSGGGIKDLGLLVQDLDQSESSAKLLSVLQGADGLKVTLSEDARAAVRNGDVAAAFVIDAGYGASLAAGEVPVTHLLRDPSRALSQQVITARMLPVLVEATLEPAKNAIFRNFLGLVGFPESGLDRAEALFNTMDTGMNLLTRVVDLEEPAEVEAGQDEGETATAGGGMDFLNDVPEMLGVRSEDVVQNADGPPKNAGVSHAFAAMAVMMLMFSLVAGAGTLLDEQEQGTLQRLLLIPSAANAILLGKTLFLVSIGLMQLAVLFVFGAIVFDVPVIEHLDSIVIISLATVVAVSGMGMMLAAFAETRKQLEGTSTLLILAMSALGGAWFPREMTPDFFQTLGNFTVTAWSMDAYHGALWYGKSLMPSEELGGFWLQIVVLLAIGAVTWMLARALFRKRYGGAQA